MVLNLFEKQVWDVVQGSVAQPADRMSSQGGFIININNWAVCVAMLFQSAALLGHPQS